MHKIYKYKSHIHITKLYFRKLQKDKIIFNIHIHRNENVEGFYKNVIWFASSFSFQFRNL